MPSNEKSQKHAVQRSEADPPGPLKAVRARVATLCQRIKSSRDPEAIREVQNELSRVGKLLGRRQTRARPGPAHKEAGGDVSEAATQGPCPGSSREDGRG